MEIPGLFNLCVRTICNVLGGDFRRITFLDLHFLTSEVTSSDDLSCLRSHVHQIGQGVPVSVSCILNAIGCSISDTFEQLLTTVIAKLEHPAYCCRSLLNYFKYLEIVKQQKECTKRKDDIGQQHAVLHNFIATLNTICNRCLLQTNVNDNSSAYKIRCDEVCREKRRNETITELSSRAFCEVGLVKDECTRHGTFEVCTLEVSKKTDRFTLSNLGTTTPKVSAVTRLLFRLHLPETVHLNVCLHTKTKLCWRNENYKKSQFGISLYSPVSDVHNFQMDSTRPVSCVLTLIKKNNAVDKCSYSATFSVQNERTRVVSSRTLKIQLGLIFLDEHLCQQNAKTSRPQITLPAVTPTLSDGAHETQVVPRVNDECTSDEVLRIKELIDNGVKQTCKDAIEDIGTKVSIDLWKQIRLKLFKPEVDTFCDVFIKNAEYLIGIPHGFLPAERLRNIPVIILPLTTYGIPWSLFERETMRLASFAHYPVSAVKSAYLLASCGFVYIGNGVTDRVKCFFCSAEMESWKESDVIDTVHMSLSPSCPMVLVQSTNNVSSNVSSQNIGGIAEFSSAMPCASASTISAPPVDDSNVAIVRLPDSNTLSRNSYSGYDEVDMLGACTDKGSNAIPKQVPNQRRDAPTSSRLATTTANSHNVRSVNIQTASFSVPGLTRDHMSSMTHSSGQPIVNTYAGGERNSYRNQSSMSTETRHQNSARSQVQQVNPAVQHPVSHHPNINSQVYAIPADTSASGLPTDATATTQDTESAPQLTYQMLGIFHERPKNAEYAVLARRMQSFADWPEDHPIKKEDLAKCGLYFAGYGDCCRCFFCGGGLRNWEDNDDPYVEHARWFEKCSFIRQYMGHDFVKAVQALKDHYVNITPADVAEYMKRNGQTIQNYFNDGRITDDAAVKSLIDAGYNSESVTRAAQRLRESGELLSADVILRLLTEDLQVPGAAGAAAVQDIDATVGNENSQNEASTERLQTLKDQNYAMRNNFMCKICMDREVKIVFLPCGHLVSCQECAVALQDCPVCRRHIRATARANIN